jgi:hypothetical protein
MLHNANILTLDRWGAVAVSSYRTIVTRVSLRCAAGYRYGPTILIAGRWALRSMPVCSVFRLRVYSGHIDKCRVDSIS